MRIIQRSNQKVSRPVGSHEEFIRLRARPVMAWWRKKGGGNSHAGIKLWIKSFPRQIHATQPIIDPFPRRLFFLISRKARREPKEFTPGK
jgi:hypothetical protein